MSSKTGSSSTGMFDCTSTNIGVIKLLSTILHAILLTEKYVSEGEGKTKQ